ncbi:peroxiredoxin [Paraphysoderma sedebokerense]|nr:peroxiredoxin [Paraphysoderma sedebokerense]
MSALVRKPAPAFKATAVVNGGEFKDLSLESYKGKYVVLLFYPMDFTFVCPTELVAFNDALDKFKAVNCEVIGISCDSRFVHLSWVNTPRKQGGLGTDFKLPLLADQTQQISRDYGVLLEQDGHPLRGLFIIDEKGVVRMMQCNDLPVGRSVDETLRLVKAFQYTDVHGEVCPANFTVETAKAKPGLVADPKGKLAYFEAVNKA